MAHEKELTAVDLRRAADDREQARKELAATMRLNRQLSTERDEAAMISEGLKYRMSEVALGQERLLSGTTLMDSRFRPDGLPFSPRLHDPRPGMPVMP